MPSVIFIDGISEAITLPTLFVEGQTYTATNAAFLNALMVHRLRVRIGWRLKRNPNLTTEEIRALTETIWGTMELSEDDTDTSDEDPILTEAFTIAKELITAQLAKEGHIVPKNIDDHAWQLAENNEEIRRRAKLRVEAQRQAATETMARL